MIEKIRDPKKSRNTINYVVYAVIFGMIIATFVFMIPGLGGGAGVVNSAADVGGTSITLRDYTDQLKRTRDQYSKIFNGEIPPYFEQNMRRQVLEGLVKREVLNQYAQRQNLMVSDVEVSDFIQKDIPAFQEDGEFDYSRYSTYLKNSRSTAKKFEGMVYKDIASRRLYDLFSEAMVKSKQEEELSQAAQSVDVKFAYLQLKEEELEKAVKISDATVSEFIEDSANTNTLADHYSKMISQFSVPAKADLGYILIKDKGEAAKISKTLTAENFSDVAKEKSEDTLSKSKGGDLGEISKGSFSPEIEAKAFSMKQGEISAPFKTGLGYAIVYVKSLTPKSSKPLSEVKSEVAKSYLQVQGVDALKESLQSAAQEGAQSLQQSLEKAGLKWSDEQSYTLGSPALPGIGASSEITDKLLSLKQNEVYKNIVSFEESEYFIKLNNLALKAQDQKAKTSQNKTDGRSSEIIELVYEDEKKLINVELNQQLLEQ